MAGLETLLAGLAKLLALALPYILAYRAGRTASRPGLPPTSHPAAA